MNIANIDPAIEKFTERDYSLEPDLINGWKAKNLYHKQIPLEFYHEISNSIVDAYQTNSLEGKLVYLGPRYSSNIEAIQKYASRSYDKIVKQSHLYGQEVTKFNYKYEKQKVQLKAYPLPFKGMNHQETNDIIFDSDFECGNLDMVVKIGDNQYDLYMRVDTNTKGHFSWFLFKAMSKNTGKVKFNICNFYKSGILYTKGMKPYILTRNDNCWKQGGQNISYEKNNKYFSNQSKPIYSLSFEFEFTQQSTQVWFAYSIPYSYSYLLTFLNSLEKQPYIKGFFKNELSYKTPSGLKIPVLTIGQTHSNKRTVLITGRMHPGETQGSWMLHNFIKFLCSQQAQKIRQQVTFKIIPMVNVDGVIIGNFRTNIKGSDINREFNFDKKSTENSQSHCVREVTYKCYPTLITYMDFHGHSTRKGVFIYGPEYPMGQNQYYTCRIYPKVLALQAEMFRYYSCIFRITQSKKYTARAAMFRYYKIPYVFTIQASTHSYINSNNQEIQFSRGLYENMGKILCYKLKQIIPVYIALAQQKQKSRRLKQIEFDEEKQQQHSLKTLDLKEDIQKSKSTKKKSSSTLQKSKRSPLKTSNKILKGLQQLCDKFPILLSLFKEIKSQKIICSIQQDDRSDCQSDDENYTKQELKDIFSNNRKSIPQAKSLSNVRKSKNLERRKTSKRSSTLITESKSNLSKLFVIDQGFVGKVNSVQDVFYSLKKVDVQAKNLPFLKSPFLDNAFKPNFKRQRMNQRNRTLQKQISKCHPSLFDNEPKSQRNLKQKQIRNSSITEEANYETIEQNKSLSFPWLQPSLRKFAKPSSISSSNELAFKMGIPSLSNQIIDVSGRKDYKRRKINKSYQLCNVSLDLHH